MSKRDAWQGALALLLLFGTVAPAVAQKPVAPPEPLAPALEPATPEGRLSLHVNVLGLLQFGLTPKLEVGGEHTTFSVGLHLLNTGALSYFVLADTADDEYFRWGVGGRVGVRHYFGRGVQRGFYAGGFFEYGAYVVQDEDVDFARYERQFIALGPEAGYRWVRPSGLLLGVGALAGPGIPVVVRDVPLGNDGCAFGDSCPEDDSILTFALLVLDVGFRP